MVVVVGNDFPPAVRGRMKLWFIEPKPNVYVSGIKDSVVDTVIDYLYKHCPNDAGIVIFRSLSRPPGYEVRTIGTPGKSLTNLSGLNLVLERLAPK